MKLANMGKTHQLSPGLGWMEKMKSALLPDVPRAAILIVNLGVISSQLVVVDQLGRIDILCAIVYNSHIDLVYHPLRPNIESCDGDNAL